MTYISWSIDFCLISWKLFSGWTSFFGSMSQYDPTSDLKIFVSRCDLYFMVHWICLISWRLFDVWTLYFVIMSQCNAAFAPKQCRSQWSIFSWSIDFALYRRLSLSQIPGEQTKYFELSVVWDSQSVTSFTLYMYTDCLDHRDYNLQVHVLAKYANTYRRETTVVLMGVK